MAIHWTDKRRARALLGEALVRAGWRLFGWTADASEIQTDYWSPASWDGVATLEPSNGGPLAVCVVDVSAAEAARLSGRGPARTAPRTDGPCSCCDGGGKATRDADAYTMQIYYGADGKVGREDHPAEIAGVTPCSACDGSGRRVESRGVVYDSSWPTFSGNPRGASWHVESGGRVVATGSGVYSALGSANDSRSDRDARFDALASRITAAATLPARVRAEAPAGAAPDVLGDVDGASFRVRASSVRPDYVEVLHAAKPSQEIRDELKRAGFRWALRSACWYGPAARLPARYAGLEAAAGGAS